MASAMPPRLLLNWFAMLAALLIPHRGECVWAQSNFSGPGNSASPRPAQTAPPKSRAVTSSRERPASPQSDDKKKDGDWPAAIATVAAGILGFAAALLVERQSWRRRKAEQVREAQLRKLLLVARSLQRAGDRIDHSRRNFVTAEDNKSAPNASTLSLKAAAEARATADALSEDLKELKLSLLELRVLHVSGAGIAEISDLISALEQGVLLLRRSAEKDPAAVVELLKFELSMERLVKNSIESLLQK